MSQHCLKTFSGLSIVLNIKPKDMLVPSKAHSDPSPSPNIACATPIPAFPLAYKPCSVPFSFPNCPFLSRWGLFFMLSSLLQFTLPTSGPSGSLFQGGEITLSEDVFPSEPLFQPLLSFLALTSV